MSGFFKSKDPKAETTFEQSPEFKALSDQLSGFFQEKVGQPGPAFGGERVAPIAPLEQAGLQKLTDFSKTGTPEGLKAAEQALITQLDPQDPANTVLFKAIREGAKRNLSESFENIADVSGGTGRFFSGARVEQKAKEAGRTTTGLNQILGQLTENILQRIPQIAQVLSGVSEQAATFPARQAETLLNLGNLPRLLEQANLDSKFQEFIRRFETTPQNIAQLATSFAGQGAPVPITTVTPGEKSPFAQLIPTATELLGAYGGQNQPTFTAQQGQQGTTGKTQSQILKDDTRKYIKQTS